MGKYTGITTASTAVETSSHLYPSRREKIVDQIVIGTPGTLKRWMTKDRALDTTYQNPGLR
jgi:ATP-dependent RNA helicase DDX19/DBP5